MKEHEQCEATMKLSASPESQTNRICLSTQKTLVEEIETKHQASVDLHQLHYKTPTTTGSYS
jgi:hypothetical protein